MDGSSDTIASIPTMMMGNAKTASMNRLRPACARS
jgi:hypothetical protein